MNFVQIFVSKNRFNLLTDVAHAERVKGNISTHQQTIVRVNWPCFHHHPLSAPGLAPESTESTVIMPAYCLTYQLPTEG